MAKPYGRQTRKQVGKILRENSRAEALTRLALIPDEQLVGHLFFYLYDMDEVVKFRSITAMGELGRRMALKHMEKARILMRRIMWNLNDESGGIGWGSPEAMGEILAKSPELALEYQSILFSYLDPKGNFLEHEVLQQGVLWGIGTYLKADPASLSEITKDLIFSYLESLDPIKRGYAVRALINGDSFDKGFDSGMDSRIDPIIMPRHIQEDFEKINIFKGWNFVTRSISEIALAQ